MIVGPNASVDDETDPDQLCRAARVLKDTPMWLRDDVGNVWTIRATESGLDVHLVDTPRAVPDLVARVYGRSVRLDVEHRSEVE